MAKKSSGSGKLRINMKGVNKEIRRGGGRVRIPEGDYVAKILGGELKTSEKSQSKYISWDFQIVKGDKKGKTLRFYNTSLKPDALWNLRNLIHAATGKNVAGKVIDFSIKSLEGKLVGIVVEDDEYDGKIRSIVTSTIPVEEVGASDADEDDEEEDSDDDESDDEDEEEEEEEEDDDDLEEVDVEEL